MSATVIRRDAYMHAQMESATYSIHFTNASNENDGYVNFSLEFLITYLLECGKHVYD